MANITGHFSCDNCYAVYLGNENGVTQKILPAGPNAWGVVNSEAKQIFNGEDVQFDAKPSDWFYLIAWSDDSVAQGMIGTFQGDSVLNTGDPGWQVLPTGKNANEAAASHPDMDTINAFIQQAQPGDWKTPVNGPDNAHSNLIYNSTVKVNNVPDDALWMWHDSGKDTSVGKLIPFKGFNHDEFLIFRFPLELVSPRGNEGDAGCTEKQAAAKAELNAIVGEKFFHLAGGEDCQAYPDSENMPACKSAEVPQLKPCFYLHFGDGESDHIETGDFEIAVLSVCNPFDNAVFRNIVISNIEVVDDKGNPVATLPNGTPSIRLIPSKLIRFSEVAPCSCEHMQIVLKTCGAIQGPYRINLEYCVGAIDLTMSDAGSASFQIEVVRS